MGWGNRRRRFLGSHILLFDLPGIRWVASITLLSIPSSDVVQPRINFRLICTPETICEPSPPLSRSAVIRRMGIELQRRTVAVMNMIRYDRVV